MNKTDICKYILKHNGKCNGISCRGKLGALNQGTTCPLATKCKSRSKLKELEVVMKIATLRQVHEKLANNPAGSCVGITCLGRGLNEGVPCPYCDVPDCMRIAKAQSTCWLHSNPEKH